MKRLRAALAAALLAALSVPAAAAADASPDLFALVRGDDGALHTAAYSDAVRGAAGGRILLVLPDIEVRGAGVHGVATPDPMRPAQQHLDDVGFERAWLRSDGRQATVAIVDSGVRATHEDLVGQVTVGSCLLGGDQSCTPDEANSPLNPHGTGVAALVAATAGNDLGIAGAAPGAHILSIRVLGTNNAGSLTDVLQGILDAAAAGADVINLSLEVDAGAAFDAYLNAFAVVIDDVRSRGVVVVAAAGNLRSGTQNPRVLPAAVPGVIAVGSLVAPGTLAPSSSTGDYVDLVAPGVSLRTAGSTTDATYTDQSGTSFAAPLVAAQVALLRSVVPTATPDQLASWITASATDQGPAGRDDSFGHGMIDPSASLELAGVPAPAALAAFADLDGTAASLTWSGGPATTTGYRVAVDGAPSVDLTAPVNAYLAAGAAAGQVFTVTPFTHYVAAAPGTAATPVLATFDAAQTAGGVGLTWTTRGRVTRVVVERAGVVIADLASDPGQFVDPSPVVGITTSYRLLVSGPTGRVASAPAPIRFVLPPVAPASVITVPQGIEVMLTWTDPGGTVDALHVLRNGVLIAELPATDREHLDQNPPIGVELNYVVVAVGPNASAPSAPVVTLVALAPVAPVLTAAQVDRDVLLTWATGGGTIVGYRIERDGNVIGTVPPTDTSFVDRSVPVGVVLVYRIVAVGPYEEAPSAEMTILVAFPPTVDVFDARQVGSVVELSWTSPGGTVDLLQIERNGALLVELAPTARSFIDASPPPHIVSDYRLVAIGPRGAIRSQPATVRVVFDPVAPEVFTATARGATVLLEWSDPGGTVDLFEIRRLGSGVIAVLEPTSRSHIDTGVRPGTTVSYEIVAAGPLRDAVSARVTVTVTTGIGAPAAVTTSTGPGRLVLTWSEPERVQGDTVVGYNVVVRSAAGVVAEMFTSGTSASFTGLPRGGSVEVEIMPVGLAGPGEPFIGSATIPRTGYWMLGADGSVYAFGESTVRTTVDDLASVKREMVGRERALSLAVTGNGSGVVVLLDSGRVVAAGVAAHHGDAAGVALDPGETVASISLTPSGDGYWIFTDRGRVLARGAAGFLGDLFSVTERGVPIGRQLIGPIISSIATPTGLGYYLVASDGGVFAFGDAVFRGSMGGVPLNRPVVGLAPSPSNDGYWLVASDGGVFAFGAPFNGSLPAVLGDASLNAPVNGLVPSGSGYLMAASDGGVFAFGTDVDFEGSLGGVPVPAPIIDIAALR